MDPQCSLATALAERGIIHLATAQFLAGWQGRAEPTASPDAKAALMTIVACLQTLPDDGMVNLRIGQIAEDLIAEIRQRSIRDMCTTHSCRRWQLYADKFTALVPSKLADA